MEEDFAVSVGFVVDLLEKGCPLVKVTYVI
jgi:hypothetical protein